MKTPFFCIVFLFLNIHILLAQSHGDAFLFSDQNYIGTARSSSMANAFGSLGADMTSIHINPAGLGLYRTFNMSFSLGLGMREMSSYYLGNKSIDKSGNFNLNSFGLTSVGKRDSESEWRRLNYGFTYNKTKIFKGSYEIHGYNQSSSLIDVFNDLAQGVAISDLNEFYEAGAFWVDLIDLNSDSEGEWYDNGEYFQEVMAGQKQHMITSNFGSMGEYQFSLATSYKEQFYLGASIGVPHIDYSQQSYYLETDFRDTSSTVQSFSMLNSMSTSAIGINFKLGGIMRVNEQIRLGLSWHSPTFYNLQDEWEMRISADHMLNDSAYSYSYNSSYGVYNYTLTTPMKIISSASFIFDKRVVVSGDLEWIDYTTMKLEGNDYNYFETQNNFILVEYKSVFNTKIGVEFNLSPLALRFGYSRFENPLANDLIEINNNYDIKDTQSWSVGLGVKNKYSSIDFAYIYTEKANNEWLYNNSYVVPAKLIDSYHNLIVTLALKF